MAGTVILVAIPLTYGTLKVVRENQLAFTVAPLAERWAQANRWQVISLKVQNTEVLVTAFGPPPEIAPEKLREALDEAGYADFDLTVQLIVGGTKKLSGKGPPSPSKAGLYR